MKERASSGGRFVVAFLLFGTTVAITILLLLAALVVWLSQLTGSFIVAALILGGLFAVVAMLIYLLVIREAVECIRLRAETVYEVARIARSDTSGLPISVLSCCSFTTFCVRSERGPRNGRRPESEILRASFWP